MRYRVLVLLALTAALAGCASVQRIDAAGDVHALLVAIRDNDRAAFDARIDRPALTRELAGHLGELVRQKTDDQAVRIAGALLAAPLAKAAVDTAVRPDVFRAIAVSLGYSPDRPIPNPLVLSRALRYTGDGQVCAARAKDKPCLLTFTREEDMWKLTAVDMSELRL